MFLNTPSGYVLSSKQDSATATRTRTLITVTLGGEQKTTKGIMSFADSSKTQTGTDVYFTDLVMDDEGTVPEIVLSLTLTNTSLFQVEATIDVSVLSTSAVIVTADKPSMIFDAVGGANATATLEIKYFVKLVKNMSLEIKTKLILIIKIICLKLKKLLKSIL